MSGEYTGLKQYPQDKRNATVLDADWMRKFLVTIETHRELFEEVIGPLWSARIEAQEEIDFGHLFLQFLLIPLHETADRHDRLDPAGPLELRRLEDRVDRFALRRVDESAGVDEDDVGVGKVVGERGTVAHQVAHQPLGVDGGLVAAERDDAEFHPR